MTLLRWLAFLLGSLTVTLTVYSFWIYFCSVWFISSDTSICSTMVFHPLGNSDHVVVSCCFHCLSIKLKMGCLLTSRSWWLFSMLNGTNFTIIWKLFLGRISLNFYMYISLIVSIRSSLSHPGFQQVVLLPYFIEITFLFVPT